MIEEYESEETEVKKDKEDLIKYLKKEISNFKPGEMIYDYLTFILKQLNELDEPEVLSSDWIKDNQLMWTSIHGAEYYVPANKLYGKIVPKQDLPAIPKFVNVYKALQDLSAPGSPHASKDVRNWIFRNQENVEKFVRAWLDDYEVEEEQKYYALIKGHENIDSDDKYWNYCIADESLDIGDNKVHADVLDEYVLSATKDEWKNLGINDDNANFVKVEELEE